MKNSLGKLKQFLKQNTVLNLEEKIKQYRWSIMLSAAIINDLIDLTGPGNIPVFGDILDVVTTTIIWRLSDRKKAVPTALEFIPGADIIPIYTISVIFAWVQSYRRKS